MAIQVKRVNPFDVREAVVELFWKLRTWPYPTKDEYFRYWDWPYSLISETVSAVWVAVDGSEIIGHMAVHFRHLCFDGHAMRAWYRKTFGCIQLSTTRWSAPCSQSTANDGALG